MKKKEGIKKSLLTIIFIFLLTSFLAMAPGPLVGSSFADNSGGNQADVNTNRIIRGIDLIYNHQFDESEVLFQDIISQSPFKPAGYFYMAMITWSRLATGFWSSESVREYKERIDLTIRVAEKLVEKNTADSYDFFYLGGALGFKGRFELMRGKWLSSFLLATEAIDSLKTCLEIDPDNKDVLLGIGTFDYYTARLSGVLKFLSYLLLHEGSKEEGLRKLNVAANEALYSATEAKSTLLHIYLFLEEDFSKAQSLAEELEIRYDRNPRFKFFRGVSYIRSGMEPQYLKMVHKIRKRSLELGLLNKKEASLWEKRSLYLETVHDLFHGRYSEARTKLQKILSRPDPKYDPAMIAWPLVKMGMSYDLEGDRDQAKKYYGRVLSMENGSGAQFMAERMLANSPAKDDPFIGY